MLTDELNTLEFRHLLKVVDDIREILHHEKISLPHIVVVGDQSHDIQADLTLIDLPGDRLQFDSVEQFIKNSAHQIKVIHISSFLLWSNYPPWVKTISSCLPHVRVFDFPGEDINHCRRVLQTYESIYNPRYDSFPHVQQWFFTHEPMPDAYLHEIFYSIRTHK
ncbi:unnamed protein product [Rotaria sordida]|uniref:Uncharacterized protein n=1 Tax=Rotaria sordida TaxID=392033 RepID=A0A819PQB6_9BILA|nr:unnamed protein product [Rotaria sordida]